MSDPTHRTQRAGPRGLLWTILILALGLRAWGVDFGLYHADEPIVVNHALAYGTGDPNPHFFMIPPLVSYLLFGVYALFFAAGRVLGYFPDPEAFKKLFVQDPHVFYVLARWVFGVLAGTAGVALLYRLGRQVLSRAGALMAALFFAVNFLHARDCHYIYVDIVMNAAVLAAAFYSLRIYQKGSLKDYLWNGFWIGAAVAAKYNAALVGAAMFAHFLRTEKKSRHLLAGTIASLAAYMLLNPFSWIDWRFFLRSLASQSAAESAVGFWHPIGNSLLPAGGVVWLILGLAGFFLFLKKDWRTAAVLFIFPALFYAHLVFFSQAHERYVLPLVPFVCLAAAAACEALARSLKSAALRRAVTTLLILGVSVFPVLKIIQVNRLFGAKGTPDLMRLWIERQVPAGSRIAFDSSFDRPDLVRSREQTLFLYKGLADGARRSKWEAQLRWSPEDRPDYYLYFLSGGRPADFTGAKPVLPFSLDALREENVRYVVIRYGVDPEQEVFYEALKKNAVLVHRASPYKNAAQDRPTDRFAVTCAPVSWRELFARERLGRVLEIYALNGAHDQR